MANRHKFGSYLAVSLIPSYDEITVQTALVPTKAGRSAWGYAPPRAPLKLPGPGPDMSVLKQLLTKANTLLDEATNSSTHPPSHLGILGPLLFIAQAIHLGPLRVPLSGERAERLTVPLYVYSKYASKMVRQNT